VLNRSTRIVDPGHIFRLRRLWILWRHNYDVIVTWRQRWRYQSTGRRLFPTRSLLDTITTKSLSFPNI